jgi:hypothetical protein
VPQPDEPLERLMDREARFAYGELPDGSTTYGRCPHRRGSPPTPVALLQDEKRVQAGLLAKVAEAVPPVEWAWAGTDQPDRRPGS